MTSHNRTVLVVENGLLLSEGVKHLLANDVDLSVISTVFQGEDALIETITTQHPDVVVLTAELTFAQWNKLRNFFEKCKELRVLVIDLEEDCIDVYDKHKVTVTRANDLLAIVRDNSTTYRN